MVSTFAEAAIEEQEPSTLKGNFPLDFDEAVRHHLEKRPSSTYENDIAFGAYMTQGTRDRTAR